MEKQFDLDRKFIVEDPHHPQVCGGRMCWEIDTGRRYWFDHLYDCGGIHAATTPADLNNMSRIKTAKQGTENWQYGTTDTTCADGYSHRDGQCTRTRAGFGGCLIATAASGTELVKDVQNFRDIRARLYEGPAAT